MSSANVVPFGKYKGQSVADIAARDPAYLQWLMNQNWFVEQYQHLVINVTNYTPASEETPAHNAMQARFLDKDYCFAFVWAAFPGVTECEIGAPQFETISDVAFYVTCEWTKYSDGEECRKGFYALVEIKPSLGDDYPAVLRQIKKQRESIETLDAVNRSPFGWVGNCVQVLLVGEYAGTGATLSQLRQMFETENIGIVMASDIDA